MLSQRCLTLLSTGLLCAMMSLSVLSPRPAAAQQPEKIFDNGNIYAVQNRPTRPTVVTFDAPTRITLIRTYHWNNARGAPAGTIALRSSSGETFGPWRTVGLPGQGGVPSAYWVALPDVIVPAGSYTVIDSHPSSWAHNSASSGTGMVAVEGFAEAAQEPADQVGAVKQDDPIGALKQVAVFDRAQRVNVGKTAAGATACYFREQGSSHTLDIGMTAEGAFIRLETGDSREATPSPPLRVFAGKQIAKGEYATNEFAVLQAYNGEMEFYTPKPDRGDFVVVAKGDPKAFFEMVARAKGEFVVVQSVEQPATVDIVAIYNFNPAAIPALLSCAKARTGAF